MEKPKSPEDKLKDIQDIEFKLYFDIPGSEDLEEVKLGSNTEELISDSLLEKIDGKLLKFIVVKIGDSENYKLVLRAADIDIDHGTIFKTLKDDLRSSEISFECLGGGFLKVDSKEKSINISGKSQTFGYEPDRNDTAKLIRNLFPGFKFEIDY
ncbi:MAG: hypothetical protein KBC81_02645 [Candidatus Pacebacteria bacterium]|nr:hypothetical protein [Candidatus Paceibacterota bacterium]